MRIGDPLDRSTDHGPQNHKAHLDKLVEYCERGVKEGATLVYGGKQVNRPGEERACVCICLVPIMAKSKMYGNCPFTPNVVEL